MTYSLTYLGNQMDEVCFIGSVIVMGLVCSLDERLNLNCIVIV